MPFVKKTVSPADLGFGAALRELRELRGYSIPALSRISGIHPALLEDLEQEKLENINDPGYAERHVTKLAGLLDVAPSYLLNSYRELLEQRGVKVEVSQVLRSCVRRKDFFVTSRFVIFGIFLLCVGVVGGYVFWQARAVSAPPRLELETPQEGEKITMPRVLVRGMTDPKAQVRLNEQPIIVDDSGNFSAFVDVPYGISVLSITAKKRYSAPKTIERHLLLERPEPQLPASTSTQESAATSTQTETPR